MDEQGNGHELIVSWPQALVRNSFSTDKLVQVGECLEVIVPFVETMLFSVCQNE